MACCWRRCMGLGWGCCLGTSTLGQCLLIAGSIGRSASLPSSSISDPLGVVLVLLLWPIIVPITPLSFRTPPLLQGCVSCSDFRPSPNPPLRASPRSCRTLAFQFRYSRLPLLQPPPFFPSRFRFPSSPPHHCPIHYSPSLTIISENVPVSLLLLSSCRSSLRTRPSTASSFPTNSCSTGDLSF